MPFSRHREEHHQQSPGEDKQKATGAALSKAEHAQFSARSLGCKKEDAADVQRLTLTFCAEVHTTVVHAVHGTASCCPPICLLCGHFFLQDYKRTKGAQTQSPCSLAFQTALKN